MNADIQTYNNSQSTEDKLICDALAEQINLHLPEAENKIWHAHPYFLNVKARCNVYHLDES